MARTLAAGLLLAIAALVALPQTALAQTTCTVNTSGRTEIWTRTLTVGERVVFGETYYGYAVSSHGTLPNPSFNVGPNGYTIGALNRLGNELQFSLNSDLEDADRTNLRLHVCGDTFNPDDARLSTGSIYIWSNAGQTWTTGDTLSVALSVASPPGAVDSSLGTVRGLRASAENGRVTLSWTPPTSGGTPTSYEYRYKTNGGYGGWTTVTGGGAARSVTVSGLTNGTRHVFEVRARNGSRVGPGYLVDATPNTRPHAVETLSASPGDRQVTLAWTPPTSGGTPTGYQYSYTTSRTEPFRNWTTVSGGGAARGVTVSGLTNGLRHAFKVRAGNGSGVGPAYLVAATPGVVGAVGNLSASPGDRQVKLTWTPPQYGAERYEYRYKTTGGYGGWATAPSGSGARSVTVYGLINGTRYTFQVQARNGASSVGTASEVTATPPGAETPPGSVGNLGASAGNRQVTLAWTPPTSGEPPTGYEYRYTRDGTWTDVGGWQRGIVTVSGLSNGRSYRFELRARNGAGAGPESEVTARPTASPTSTAPDAVGNLSASAGYRQVTLTWSQPTSGGTPTNYEYTYSTSRTEPFRDWTTVTGGGAARSVIVTGLTNGARHAFKVRAWNASGVGTASEVTATPPAAAAATEATPLTAAFEDAPSSHDGATAFTVRLALSEAVSNTADDIRDNTFTVSGGTLSAVRAVDGRSDLWELTIAPSGAANVGLILNPGGTCDTPGTLCTGDGRTLSGGLALSIAAAAAAAATEPPAPLTARFDHVPAEHDGGTSFKLELVFSAAPQGMNNRAIRRALEVSGGRARDMRRVDQDLAHRSFLVQPDGSGAVTVSLPPTADCAAPGAFCTAEGGRLETGIATRIAGPPASLSVADATVEEAAGAVLEFAVTLNPRSTRAVTVDYATSDGTTTAGADYVHTEGTLRFATGETSKTVRVEVIDDSHDEGEETLTLTLSNVSGGRIADGTATGTIENSDPLPRALMARFGRTAAVHVVEHVEERLQAPRAPGFRGRFAGRELRRGMERDMALSFLNQLGGGGGLQSPGGGVHGTAMAGSRIARAPGTPGLGGVAGMPGVAGGMMSGAPGPMSAPAGPAGGLFGGGLQSMGLGGDSLLTGSAFALNRETRHGGILSFWSRGAQSHFTGREEALSLGGNVRTSMFGADYQKGPLVTGLSLSHSRGLGKYLGVDGGQVASAVTGLYPWLGYKATDRVTVWGVAGYGAGGLLLTPEGGQALESGLSMAMTAAGTRGELVAGGAGGFDLAFKADALWVGTATDDVDGPAGRLKGTKAAVTRFRTGLEGSRGYTLGGRMSLTPSVEVGLRHDGGDAETGAGMDVGAGLVMSDPSTGLSVDVRVRTLLVHQAEGFRERGVALSLSYNQTPSTALGFVARVAPSWGGQATSGAEALWGRDTMAGMGHGSFAQGNRIDGEIGYGLPVGSRFVGTPRVRFGTSEHGRDYRVGYALGVLNRESLNFELGVDAQRRESPRQGSTDNGVVGRATVGW